MVELEDEGGEGESAKGKRGTPLRGGSFYHSPFVLYFHFPWLMPEKVKVECACFMILFACFCQYFCQFLVRYHVIRAQCRNMLWMFERKKNKYKT